MSRLAVAGKRPRHMVPGPASAKVAQWIRESDYVLIGAGAGMSTEAGIDYNDTVSFAKNHPAMVRKGFSYCYQFLGPVDWDGDEEKWGYLGHHFTLCLNTPVHEPTYGALRDLVAGKDTFVLTSNVDGLFEKTGFPTDKIYTPQGDFRNFQCLASCRKDSVWNNAEQLAAIEASLDPETEKCATDAIPVCPHCGGPATFNLRGGSWFNHGPYEGAEAAFGDWVERVAEDISAKREAGKPVPRVLVLDVGTGFNTPSVVRFRVEQIAGRMFRDAARFVRINRDYPQFHLKSYAEDRKGVLCQAFASSAGEAFGAIAAALAAKEGAPVSAGAPGTGDEGKGVSSDADVTEARAAASESGSEGRSGSPPAAGAGGAGAGTGGLAV